LFRTIYSVTAPFSKTDYYDPFVYAGENRDIFTERNEALHGKYRRQISAIFSSENIKDLDHNFDGTLQKFISQMDLFKSQNVDLGQWLERLLFGSASGFALCISTVECQTDDPPRLYL
jgi:hypothetical protein